MISNPLVAKIPVSVQGELVPADRMLVLAMIAMVAKYGQDGRLSIPQAEAEALIGQAQYVYVEYDFASDAMILRVR